MARKFFVQMTSGDKFEISELDYNNLQARIQTGRTNGWYIQRGESMGERKGWQLNFSDISGIWSDNDKREDKPVRNIDVEKRKPQPVGKKEEPKDDKCKHNWLDNTTWEHVTNIVGGVNRYYKQCKECGAKSPLVKKREVELAQKAKGLTIDDVPLVE